MRTWGFLLRVTKAFGTMCATCRWTKHCSGCHVPPTSTPGLQLDNTTIVVEWEPVRFWCDFRVNLYVDQFALLLWEGRLSFQSVDAGHRVPRRAGFSVWCSMNLKGQQGVVIPACPLCVFWNCSRC